MKPSATSCRVASSVAPGSGSSVSSSPITSTLMKSDRPAARPRRASRTACSTVVAPAVLGSNVKLLRSMSASSDWPPSWRPRRRTARVIMLGPACRRHSASTLLLANLPVPWISRERRRTPPITSGSVAASTWVAIRTSPASAAPDELDDFDHVAGTQGLIEALAAPVDDAVELDHNAPREDLEASQQLAHGPELAEGHRVAVHGQRRRRRSCHLGETAGAARCSSSSRAAPAGSGAWQTARTTATLEAPAPITRSILPLSMPPIANQGSDTAASTSARSPSRTAARPGLVGGS